MIAEGKRCGKCRWWLETELNDPMGWCVRFPHSESKGPLEFCGEFKPKKAGTEKIAETGRGVVKGTKRGKYKIKRGAVHENGSGVPAGEKASSQYLGVSVQKRRGGRKRYIGQLRTADGYKHLGTHNKEELAAAAVQEHLGNKEEATRLRKLAEAETDREIRQLKEEDKVTAWDCKGCGQGYKYKPDQCGKCNGSSFTPSRPEEKEGE